MVEFYSNKRFSGQPEIKFSSEHRISFNAEFVKRNNLNDMKFCYISNPDKDRKGIKISFFFTEDTNIMPDVKPFRLNKHPKTPRFQITPKAWFNDNELVAKDLEGSYSPIEKKDPKLGKLYTIFINK